MFLTHECNCAAAASSAITRLRWESVPGVARRGAAALARRFVSGTRETVDRHIATTSRGARRRSGASQSRKSTTRELRSARATGRRARGTAERRPSTSGAPSGTAGRWIRVEHTAPAQRRAHLKTRRRCPHRNALKAQYDVWELGIGIGVDSRRPATVAAGRSQCPDPRCCEPAIPSSQLRGTKTGPPGCFGTSASAPAPAPSQQDRVASGSPPAIAERPGVPRR